MAGPTAAAPCSESPRQDSPQAKRYPGEKLMGYDMAVLPAPVPLWGSSPTATGPPAGPCPLPVYRRQLQAQGPRFPQPCRAELPSPPVPPHPQGRPSPQDSHCSDTAGLLQLMSQQVTQHRRPPTLWGRTAPDAGAPLLPGPEGKRAQPRGPAPPARPAPRPLLPGRGGHRHITNFRPPARPPALIGRHRREVRPSNGPAALPADWQPPQETGTPDWLLCLSLRPFRTAPGRTREMSRAANLGR